MWVATDLLSRTAWYAAHPNRETVRQVVRAVGLLLGWAWVNLRTMGLNFGTLCEGCGEAFTTYGNEEDPGEPWKF
jgi:hypothetical protein